MDPSNWGTGVYLKLALSGGETLEKGRNSADTILRRGSATEEANVAREST